MLANDCDDILTRNSIEIKATQDYLKKISVPFIDSAESGPEAGDELDQKIEVVVDDF
jgi:hypothetical protein